jgi:PIN domain nuclease of toxin-antitoxin system
MLLIVDAHALLWALEGSTSPLTATTRHAIADPANDVVVSAATIWEIEVKRAAGRLASPDNLLEIVDATRIDVVPITGGDATAAARLPMHHRDPFDRMLIAQAARLDATVVTRDRAFAAYDVPVLVA